MCGRFTISADGETIRTEFGLPDMPFDYRPRYNVAPMQAVVGVIRDGHRKRAGWLRWGLVPGWAPDPSSGARLINARAETIDEKSAFREAFEKRRCLVVADGYFEWQRVGSSKVPMHIRLKGRRPFGFAGLWERWSRPGAPPLMTCTILTTEPAASIEHIHDRMPVILTVEARAQWLDRNADAQSLKRLLRPYQADEIEAYPVSQLVNSVENDSPECIAPADPPSQPVTQTSLF